ncbi:MAG: hypothetical protein L3J20_01830 [Flavobacteriaceae bacterium]|nr:hypothetical protein [Flavobacteriaceae bacterium]
MKKTIIIFFLIIAVSCITNDSNQKSLKNSEALNKIFSKEEVSDLHKVLTFFDTQIMDSFKSESLNESYGMFNLRDLELKKEGLIFGDIPLLEQKKIISSLGESTFNEVWLLGKSFRENGEEVSILFINPDGKYANYLEELGVRNGFFKNYIKIVKETGDIPPILFYSITDNYKDFDISDENIRLVIAIHYLILNDNGHGSN